MVQLSLAPVRIVQHQNVNFGTAHAFGLAQGDDGLFYIIKKNGYEPLICATEYLGNSLAMMVNLPVAPFKQLEMPDGNLVFGSNVFDPLMPEIEVCRALTEPSNNELVIEQAKEVLSASLAFDLAIRNPDRHLNNYLLVPNSKAVAGRRSASIRLIDFAGSDLLSAAESDAAKMSTNTPTWKVGRETIAKHGFSAEAANRVLDTLEKGEEFIVDKALSELPNEWMSDSDRSAFSARIKNGLLKKQLNYAREGIMNGVAA